MAIKISQSTQRSVTENGPAQLPDASRQFGNKVQAVTPIPNMPDLSRFAYLNGGGAVGEALSNASQTIGSIAIEEKRREDAILNAYEDNIKAKQLNDFDIAYKEEQLKIEGDVVQGKVNPLDAPEVLQERVKQRGELLAGSYGYKTPHGMELKNQMNNKLQTWYLEDKKKAQQRAIDTIKQNQDQQLEQLVTLAGTTPENLINYSPKIDEFLSDPRYSFVRDPKELLKLRADAHKTSQESAASVVLQTQPEKMEELMTKTGDQDFFWALSPKEKVNYVHLAQEKVIKDQDRIEQNNEKEIKKVQAQTEITIHELANDGFITQADDARRHALLNGMLTPEQNKTLSKLINDTGDKQKTEDQQNNAVNLEVGLYDGKVTIKDIRRAYQHDDITKEDATRLFGKVKSLGTDGAVAARKNDPKYHTYKSYVDGLFPNSMMDFNKDTEVQKNEAKREFDERVLFSGEDPKKVADDISSRYGKEIPDGALPKKPKYKDEKEISSALNKGDITPNQALNEYRVQLNSMYPDGGTSIVNGSPVPNEELKQRLVEKAKQKLGI